MANELCENLGSSVQVFDPHSTEAGSLRHEMAASSGSFRRLLETCVDIYLEDPKDFELPEATAAHQLDRALDTTRIAQQFGGRRRYGEALADDDNDPSTQYIRAALRAPELFMPESSPEVVVVLERFGEAYIHDMYRSTGIQAPDPDADLTVEQQLEELYDLADAVEAIGSVEEANPLTFTEQQQATMLAKFDQNGQYYYDPLRLSPKTYPNNVGITATCAAKMAIVAGYSQAARWDHMTTNVVTPSELSALASFRQLMTNLNNIHKEARLRGHISNILSITDLKNSVNSITEIDPGFHGCNLVKLADGAWWQIDLTRDIFHRYDDKQSREFDTIHQNLKNARSDRVPTVELFNEPDFADIIDTITQAANDIVPNLLSTGAVARKLDKLGPRTTLDKVTDQLLLPLILSVMDLSEDTLSEGNHFGLDVVARLMPEDQPYTAGAARQYIRTLALEFVSRRALLEKVHTAEGAMNEKTMLHAEISPDEDCSNDCLRDNLRWPHNRTELVNWLRSAPLTFFVKLAGDLAIKVQQRESMLPHPSLEVANPAQHLGVLVLNNYAAVYATKDEQLPAGWWIAHDPTQMGTLTHMDQSISTPSASPTINMVNLLSNLPDNGLRDTTKQARMKEFLKRAKANQSTTMRG